MIRRDGPTDGVPQISVVIPVYNGTSTIAACLSALSASELASYEVIVIDDSSTDDTPAIARTFPCRVIVTTENRGAAAARNRGAAAARGELLFFLDADILVTPSTLRMVAESFAARPDVSALFGSYQKGTVPANFFSRYKNLVHHYTHQTAREDAATFCGGFGAIRRDVFLVVGGFDESYRALEDIELGYRLYLAGRRIWLNKALLLTHCKTYSFTGLVRSDLFGRAVPWTRLMLRKRIVRNDLNTRIHNVLSVPVAFGLFPALAATVAFPAWAWLPVALVVLFVLLNRAFFAHAWREGGAGFALRVTAMTWVTYLYSGLGLGLGLLAFIGESPLPGRKPDPSHEDSPSAQDAAKALGCPVKATVAKPASSNSASSAFR
jgi:glycosyltransferase involved in cell wall biosynthesis